MKKRILAMFCLLAVLVATVALGFQTDAVSNRYLVGYAIKDMNPWLDYNDHSKGLNTGLFTLTGNGDDSDRLLAGLFDDNGDGVQGEGDGLYTTATAVTDAYGKTVIYVTIDSLQSWSQITTDARSSIVKALGSDVIAPEQIMISASHTHSGGFFASMRGSSATADQKVYFNYIISQITAAAVEAYGDRAEAVMTKGTINAKESTAHLGYNGGNGYQMNAIRHYEVTLTRGENPESAPTYKYLIGSGDGIDNENPYGSYRPISFLPYTKEYTKVKTYQTIDTPDNDMHVLKFDFPNDSTKEPVVFVNWRAHTTMNSGNEMYDHVEEGYGKRLLSSDYVNGLRTALKANGYRSAFFQGAAGNVVTTAKINTWSTDATYKDWRADPKVTSDEMRTYVYGTMLAEIAMDCMDRMMGEEITAGRIVNGQMTWHGELQQESEGLRAGAAYLKRLADNGTSVEYPYQYTHTDGKTYIINTSGHRNHILEREAAAYDYTDLELNVIALGEGVVFITAPNELEDYYNIGSMEEAENDWLDLVDATYGTPFVLGYTNGTSGYIANWMDHIYNTREYYEITGYGETGDTFFGPGTYESMVSRFAQGEGERLLETFHRMIDTAMEGERVAYCEACKKEVVWKPIMGTPSTTLNLGTGHYYLWNDLPLGEKRGVGRFNIASGEVLCLDLNGHTVETASRSVTLGKGGTFNLSDSVGTGKLISYSGGNNVAGGAVNFSDTATMNMYGGTIQFIRKSDTGINDTGAGATIYVRGTLNLYGGTLIGGELAMTGYWGSTETRNGCGATVFVHNNSALNIFGGKIIAGTTPYEARGSCVYLFSKTGHATISGNAEVDEIYMNTSLTDTTLKNWITISDTFTGRLGIRTRVESLPVNSQLATLNNATIAGATITYTAKPEYQLVSSGSVLKLANRSGAAAVVYENYQATTYGTLGAALAACDKGLVTLLKHNTENLTISKDIYLDLNGFNLQGNLTIAEGKTLYGMDSETDDFTVADGVYGKILHATGNVQGMEEAFGHTKDSYLLISDDEGISFHRVQLHLTAMSFRPSQMGLYYQSAFAGDELVAQQVDRFGVALSLAGEPNAENFATQCKASWFTGFQSGADGNAASKCSTLLKGILKPENSQEMNAANATTPVYGRAYVLTKDGRYVFGHSNSRTLKLQLKDVDKIWSSLTTAQKQEVQAVYDQYEAIMSGWGFSNLK